MSFSGRLASKLTDYDNPRSMGSRLRARRIAPLLALIDDVYKDRGAVSIIDIGGTDLYWSIVAPDYLDRHNVSITVVNIPGAELPDSYGRFTFVVGNGCKLSGFGDGSFDIAHSNSVLEHVGEWRSMQAFADETRRVAKRYFVQTPNFWFPIEPHFMAPLFHWLPRSWRIGIIRRVNLGQWPKQPTLEAATAAVDSARLLTRRQFELLFPDAQIVIERVLGVPKSLIAIRS